MRTAPRMFLFVATVWLQCGALCGQAVDPSVGVVDLSVKTRVQDTEHPDSPLSPGASGQSTGALPTILITQTATQTPPTQTGSSHFSQFPSLTSMSSWVGASSSTLSAGMESTPSQSTNVAESRRPALSRLTVSRKPNMILAGVDVEPAKSNRSPNEHSAEGNAPSDTDAKLRMLKRAEQKAARLRVKNPFQDKADAVNAGRWNGTALSARALQRQRHQEGERLLNGYDTDSEQRRRRRRSQRGSLSLPGSR
jgi:hypothetical protein